MPMLSYLDIYCVTHERGRWDDTPVLVILGVCRLNWARLLVVLVGFRWLRLDVLVWLKENVLVRVKRHRYFHADHPFTALSRPQNMKTQPPTKMKMPKVMEIPQKSLSLAAAWAFNASACLFLAAPISLTTVSQVPGLP